MSKHVTEKYTTSMLCTPDVKKKSTSEKKLFNAHMVDAFNSALLYYEQQDLPQLVLEEEESNEEGIEEEEENNS